MSFDPGSKLDSSQLLDRRGVSGRTAAIDGAGGLGIVGRIVGFVVVSAGGGAADNMPDS